MATQYTTNPVTITLTTPTQGNIVCISNAAYYQRVTLTFQGGPTVVFQGSGEDQIMAMPNGQTVYLIPASSTNQQVSILFQNSPSGPNGPFQNSQVETPTILDEGNKHFINVESEDSNDDDNNDSYLSINYYSA